MLRLAAWVLILLPLAFGLVRLVTTAFSDVRYVTMALLSMFVAAAVFRFATTRVRDRRALAMKWLLALLLTTGLSASWALILGTGSGPGLWLVAFAFGLCHATGFWVRLLYSRRA